MLPCSLGHEHPGAASVLTAETLACTVPWAMQRGAAPARACRSQHGLQPHQPGKGAAARAGVWPCVRGGGLWSPGPREQPAGVPVGGAPGCLLPRRLGDCSASAASWPWLQMSSSGGPLSCSPSSTNCQTQWLPHTSARALNPLADAFPSCCTSPARARKAPKPCQGAGQPGPVPCAVVSSPTLCCSAGLSGSPPWCCQAPEVEAAQEPAGDSAATEGWQVPGKDNCPRAPKSWPRRGLPALAQGVGWLPLPLAAAAGQSPQLAAIHAPPPPST